MVVRLIKAIHIQRKRDVTHGNGRVFRSAIEIDAGGIDERVSGYLGIRVELNHSSAGVRSTCEGRVIVQLQFAAAGYRHGGRRSECRLAVDLRDAGADVDGSLHHGVAINHGVAIGIHDAGRGNREIGRTVEGRWRVAGGCDCVQFAV